MNALLKKILINLSIFVFVATFFISMNVGAPILNCFFRGSIALLVVAVIGRVILINFFKDIAFEIARYERQKEQKKDKDTEQIDEQDDYGMDETTSDEEDDRKGSILDNPFADNEYGKDTQE